MIIFPDIEKTLVPYFRTALAAQSDEVCSRVRVGTKKAPAGNDAPLREVVLVASYGLANERILRDATVTIDVYAENYDTASTLALIVSAVAPACVGDVIKRAEVTLGPVRTVESSTAEKRSLTLELIVKGSEL